MKLPGYNTLQLIFSSALTVLPQNLHRSPEPGLRQVASDGEPLTRVLAGKPTTPLNRRPYLNKPAVEVPTEFLSQFSLYRFLHQLTFRCHPHSEDYLSLTCLELRSLRPASLRGLHRKEEFSLSASPAPVDVLEGKIQDILQAVPREIEVQTNHPVTETSLHAKNLCLRPPAGGHLRHESYAKNLRGPGYRRLQSTHLEAPAQKLAI